MDKRGQRKIDPKQYVVDASVIAKWVLPVEPCQDNALKLRDDHISGTILLFSPTILLTEVTNVLWKAVKFRRIPLEDAHEALKNLENLKINEYELGWFEHSEVLKIGCKIDCAIYDATYIFLSNKIKAPFITSDNKLYEKAKRHFEILQLKDYATTSP